MSKLIRTAAQSEAGAWAKDVAALASIGALIWVVGTWAAIAQSALVG
jgi:hypothetical protein